MEQLMVGVKRNEAFKFLDKRGWFVEQVTSTGLEAMGFRPGYLQINTVYSVGKVLRGMHRQNQAKYVTVLRGRIFDVALNPETSEWVGYELREGQSLYIPPQYAHGYLVLSDEALVQYAVDRPYKQSEEEIFSWDGYGIEWPLCFTPTLSAKDSVS
jgi:dTDP-4-dehydrorhamnose 3,5-epimerase